MRNHHHHPHAHVTHCLPLPGLSGCVSPVNDSTLTPQHIHTHVDDLLPSCPSLPFKTPRHHTQLKLRTHKIIDVSTSWRQPGTMATLYSNCRSMITQGMQTQHYSIQSILYSLEHIRCLASGVREIRVRYYSVFRRSCCTSVQCDAIWLQTTFINMAWDL